MPTHRPDAVAELLEQFIRDRFKVPPDDRIFSRSVKLWDEGYIDSIGVTEMIAFLESTFAVKISNEVVFSPEFTYIDGIADLVVGLQMGMLSGDPSTTIHTGSAA